MFYPRQMIEACHQASCGWGPGCNPGLGAAVAGGGQFADEDW